MSSRTKTDSRPSAHAAKLDLRRRVLNAVSPAHVFEGFCGPSIEGSMSEVWSRATMHVACDKRFTWPDPRYRYVGDTLRVMRAIDLGQFNVFDFDAYGSPWTAMRILLARRRWLPGERGAVVLTDGSGQRAKFGWMPADVADLVGISRPPPKDNGAALHTTCLAAWMERAGVAEVQRWMAVSRGGGVAGGGITMVYSAAVFEGFTRPEVAAGGGATSAAPTKRRRA